MVFQQLVRSSIFGFGEIVYLRGGFLVGEWSERIAFQYVSDADSSSPIIQEHGANP